MGIHGVLSMPFSGYDLMNRITSVQKDFALPVPERVDPPDVRLRPEGRRRQDDDRLQSRGRHRPARSADRAHRRQPAVRRPALAPQGADGRPSILDLPTDRIAESDLSDVLWRDPSGIDILLAPPRIEMAEMITPAGPRQDPVAAPAGVRRDRHRHVERGQRHQPRVPRCERHDHRDRHLRLDHDPQHDRDGRHVPLDRLPGVQGPLPREPLRQPGGIDPNDLHRALGRVPEHEVVSDGPLVVKSNNEGVPFVLADASAQVSRDIGRVAAELLGAGRVPVGAGQR